VSAGAAGSQVDPCSQAKESLTVCMQFITDLTFYSVPDVLSDIVTGGTAFVILAKIFASTSRRIYSQVRKMCCPDAKDPTLLFRRLEDVTRLIGGGSYRAKAEVRREEDGIHMVFSGLEHLHGRLINVAPIIGVLAGMIEAMDMRATPLSSKDALRHAPAEAWKIYPLRVEEDTAEIVIVPPAAGEG